MKIQLITLLFITINFWSYTQEMSFYYSGNIPLLIPNTNGSYFNYISVCGCGGGGGGGGGGNFISGNFDGGNGGSGRVILKVKTPVNINPLSTAVGPASLISYPDTTTTNKFEGIVSMYNRVTGAITITNIQNISGTFAVPSDYTFDVNTINGVNAGTNIEIINSKVNLSMKSDIQMNDKAIVSPTALYLEVPVSASATTISKFFNVNVNGSSYKIALYNP